MKQIPSSDPLSNPYFSSEDREWVAVVNKRYELEDLWLNAVRTGDPEGARKHLLPYLIVRGDFSYLQIEPMENARRACRTINVSCRIAAREAGCRRSICIICVRNSARSSPVRRTCRS